MHLAGAQIAATAGASAFAFFAVAAFQGVLINLASPSTFRRISPSIQMFGMSLMVVSLLLLYPIYSMLLRSTAATHPRWLWFFPPFWFSGMYDLMLPRADPLFASLGRFAVKALCVAAITFALAPGRSDSGAITGARSKPKILSRALPPACVQNALLARPRSVPSLHSPAGLWRAVRSTGCFLRTLAQRWPVIRFTCYDCRPRGQDRDLT